MPPSFVSSISAKRVLICGSRHWSDAESISRELDNIGQVACVIEGEAPGADKLARQIAEARSILVVKFLANWSLYGRAAGPIRNRQMIEEGCPDVVLAFHENLSASRGTQNLIKQAKKAGIPTLIFTS